MEASGGCEVCGGDGGGEGTSFMDRRRRGEMGGGSGVVDVSRMLRESLATWRVLAVGVEEDVSVFWSFCQQIFGSASGESRAGAVEGE